MEGVQHTNGSAADAFVLLTGGCGYIGTHILVQLLNDNIQVVVVDNLVGTKPAGADGKPVCLKRVEELTGKSINFVDADIGDAPALQTIFTRFRIECVIHLAALKSVGDSCRLPLDYYRNNVAGTITLLEVMKSNGVKRIVFSSSATVYGEPQYLPIDESHPTGHGVTNPYGRTKYIIEEILRDLCSSDPEWNVICLRYFNPVGAHPSGRIGEDPRGIPNNLMPYVTQVAIGRRPKLSVYGSDYPTPDGTGVRDYIHIMDLSDGHLAARKMVTNGLASGWRAYNLGLGKGYSVLEMVNAFEAASGRPVPVDIVARRPGDVAVCYSDCSLAERELGWKANRGLPEMCEDMWRWQSMNPDGYAE